MTIEDFYSSFSKMLQNLYDESEAETIAKWFLEDFYHKSWMELSLDKSKIISEDEFFLMTQIQARVLGGEPIQYVFQKASFLDLELEVNPSVLIPRPETEELCLLIFKNIVNPLSIIDVCSGSGNIALSMKSEYSDSKVYGLELSKSAIETAKKNALTNKLDVQFLHGDALNLNLIEDIKDSNFDLIISNPPYVLESEKEQMHKNVLNFEPPTALFVQQDNAIIFYQKIIDFAVNHLTKNGLLAFELNPFTALEVKNYALANGFKNAELFKDFRGSERFLLAKF